MRVRRRGRGGTASARGVRARSRGRAAGRTARRNCGRSVGPIRYDWPFEVFWWLWEVRVVRVGGVRVCVQLSGTLDRGNLGLILRRLAKPVSESLAPTQSVARSDDDPCAQGKPARVARAPAMFDADGWRARAADRSTIVGPLQQQPPEPPGAPTHRQKVVCHHGPTHANCSHPAPPPAPPVHSAAHHGTRPPELRDHRERAARRRPRLCLDGCVKKKPPER